MPLSLSELDRYEKAATGKLTLDELDAYEKAANGLRPVEDVGPTGYLETAGRGLAMGTMGIGQGIGASTRWAGEVIGSKPIAEAGRVASEYWKKSAEGLSPRGPEFTGTFVENPSAKKALLYIAQAAPSLAAALTVGTIAGPAAAATGLGLLEGAPQYEEARAKGKSVKESSGLGAASTAGTAILEFLPISRFLKGIPGGIAARAGKGAVIESGQEMSQQLWQNLIAKYGYDKTRSLAEGIVEAGIGAAGTGAIAGTIFREIEPQDLEAAKADLDNQAIDTANKIAATATQEQPPPAATGLGQFRPIGRPDTAQQAAGVFQAQPPQVPAAESAMVFEQAGDAIQQAARKRQAAIDMIYEVEAQVEARKEEFQNRLNLASTLGLGGINAETVRGSQGQVLPEENVPVEEAPSRAGLTGGPPQEVLQPSTGIGGEGLYQPVQGPISGGPETEGLGPPTPIGPPNIPPAPPVAPAAPTAEPEPPVITPDQVEALRGLNWDYDDIFLMNPRDAEYNIKNKRTPADVDTSRLEKRAGEVDIEDIGGPERYSAPAIKADDGTIVEFDFRKGGHIGALNKLTPEQQRGGLIEGLITSTGRFVERPKHPDGGDMDVSELIGREVEEPNALPSHMEDDPTNLEPRLVETEIRRTQQEQAKRRRTLSNEDELAQKAQEGGLTVDQMRQLLENNYRENQVRLDRFTEYSKSDEFNTKKAASKERAGKIKFKEFPSEPKAKEPWDMVEVRKSDLKEAKKKPEPEKKFINETPGAIEVKTPANLSLRQDTYGQQRPTPYGEAVKRKQDTLGLVVEDRRQPGLFGKKAEPAETAEEAKAEPGKIEDFGEKIGGARKDTAERGYTMGGKKETPETGEAWRKKYVAMEKVNGSGWTIGKAGDTWGISAGRSQVFQTKEEAEKAIPLFAVADKHRVYDREPGKFEIFKKVGDRKLFKVVNKIFPSREEAMKYMAGHAEEILNIKTAFGEEILPVPEIAVRKGIERRKGPATPEIFMETFAPRGIEFGNWNNQEERQQVLNHAYDGLLDLAEILKVPPKTLMLDGELAIAFGARGQGLSGAAAHYEREYGIINLTKMKGAGKLAHEWFHALDHYFGRQDTKAKSEKIKNERGDLVYPAKSTSTDYLSHGASYKSKVRPELQKAYKDLIETMYSKAEQFVEDTEQADRFVAKAREHLKERLDVIRANLSQDLTNYHKSKGGYSNKAIKYFQPASAEQLAEWDRLANILIEGGDLQTSFKYNHPGGQVAEKVSQMPSRKWGMLMAGRHSNDTLDGLNAILKSVRNRTGFNKEGHGDLDRVRAAMTTYSERLKMFEDAKAGTEKTKKVPTSYRIEAKKMDQSRTSDYWGEPHEMAARAFAAYVEDKVAEQGNQSDFIVYQAHGGIILPMIDGFIARPYPEGKEREAINKAFDNFVGTLQTKETDKGIALFSRRQFKPVDTESPEFKRWFSGSKVVDSEGKPLRVYHGSMTSFDQFKYGDIGYHFGTSEQASHRLSWPGENDPGQQIYPAYLSIKNPLNLVSDLGDWSDMGMLKEYLTDGNGGPFTGSEFDKFKTAKDVRNGLIEKGYDGIKYQNSFEGATTNLMGSEEQDAYIAFSPTQIKSAISNTGEFSSTDPRIQFSRQIITPDHIKTLTPYDKNVLMRVVKAKQKIENPTDEDLANFLDDAITDSGLHNGYLNRIFNKIGGEPNALYNSQKRDTAQSKGRSYAEQIIRSGLKEWGYRNAASISIKTLGLSKEEKAVQKIAEALGLDPYYFKTSDPNLDLINGVIFSHHPETIYINSGTPNPLIQVAGHEFVHSLKRIHPDLYNFLDDCLKRNVVDFKSYFDTLKRNNPDIQFTKERGQEELYGDFVGDQWAKPEFWEKLNQENPSLTRRLADFINSIIEKIKRALKRYFPTADKHFKDINYAQEVIAKVMSETAQRAGAPRGTTEGEALAFDKLAEKWHSQMTNFLSEKLPGKGTGKSYLDTINSWAKKGLIKQEELEWSGLTEYLSNFDTHRQGLMDEHEKNISRQKQIIENAEGESNFEAISRNARELIRRHQSEIDDLQDGKITKQAVLDFLAENNVRVEEVEKGKKLSAFDLKLTDELKMAGFTIKYKANGSYNLLRNGKLIESPSDAGQYKEQVQQFFEENDDIERGSETKFSQYQVPGAKDYRELLLTLPAKMVSIQQAFSENQVPLKYIRDGHETDIVPSPRQSYYSAHWDEPNVLAHVRFNERTGPNGERILFIEEVQSDWHQKGRKEGYKEPISQEFKGKIDAISKAIESDFRFPTGEHSSMSGDGLVSWFRNLEVRLRAHKNNKYIKDFIVKRFGKEYFDKTKNLAEQQKIDQPIYGGVPDAPFKKTWPILAIKRMVRYAAENGFDSIAWTPGDVQADRYDLSKQIDEIRYIKHKDGSVYLGIYKGGSEIGQTAGIPDSVPEQDIEKYVGKEVAQKIIDGGDKGKLSGLDLKVGGEGMKGFYDKILPAEVNKFFNKAQWGNAKVGTAPVLKSKVSVSNTGGQWEVFLDGESRGFYATENEAVKRGKELKDVRFEAWQLKITPEMKSKALREGMPLFKKAGEPGTEPAFSKRAKEDLSADTLSIYERLSSYFEKGKPVIGTKKDLSYFKDLIASVPAFFKDRGIPAVKTIVDSTSERVDEKAENELWMENNEIKGSPGVINTVRAMKNLSRQDFRKFQDYLIKTDQTQMGFRVKEDTDLKNNKVWFVKDRAGHANLYQAKTEAEAVEKLLEFEAKDLEKQGFTPEQVQAVIAVRMTLNKGFELLFRAMRELIASIETQNKTLPKNQQIKLPDIPVYRDGKHISIDLKQAMAEMGDMRGYYFPRIRKPGKFVMTARKQGNPPILETFDSRILNKPRVKELEKQGYTVTIGPSNKLGEDVFQMAGNLVKTQQIVNAALERVNRQTRNELSKDYIGNITKDIEDLFASALAEQVSNVIRERGARAHMTQRGQELYLGYEQNPLIAIPKYIKGLAGAEAKKNMVAKMLKALTGTGQTWAEFKSENPDATYEDYADHVKEMMIEQGKQPNAFKWAMAYIGENTRNPDFADNIIGTLRGAAVGKYLAFRVFSAPLVNLTALPTSTIATLKGAGISYGRAWKELGKGIQLYGKYLWNKDGMTEKDRWIFDHISKKGWDNAQYSSESLTALRSTVGKGWDKIIDVGMFTFSQSEKLNRAATIAAAFNGLSRLPQNKGKTKAEIAEMAKQVSDDSHGVYNKGNYPYIALGGNPAAHLVRMMYVFQRFSHTYLLNMAKLGFEKKDYTALAHMVVAPAVLAGAGASVLSPIISAILRAFGLDEPEEKAYQKAGEIFGPSGENLARFGLAGLAGFSIKGSLSLGVGAIPTSVKDVLGAPGNVISDIFIDGIPMVAEGNLEKGFEKIMPTGFGNIIRAYRESTEGLTTKSNRPVFYGKKQVKTEGHETFLRAVSLYPSRIAAIREKQYKEFKTEQKYSEKREDIYASIKKFHMAPVSERTKEKWLEILAEIQAYNESAEKVGPHITRISIRSIHTMIKRSFKPSRKEQRRGIR